MLPEELKAEKYFPLNLWICQVSEFRSRNSIFLYKSMKFSESLKKNRDFQFVYRNGKSWANRYLVLYVLRTEGARNRIGISVSKKVGNSVVRHRLTRLIRESYRLNEAHFDDGLDMIVIARPGAKERNFFEIESALLHLARKSGVLVKEDSFPDNADGGSDIRKNEKDPDQTHKDV